MGAESREEKMPSATVPQRELSIEYTFDPPSFSPDTTFKMSSANKEGVLWGHKNIDFLVLQIRMSLREDGEMKKLGCLPMGAKFNKTCFRQGLELFSVFSVGT